MQKTIHPQFFQDSLSFKVWRRVLGFGDQGKSRSAADQRDFCCGRQENPEGRGWSDFRSWEFSSNGEGGFCSCSTPGASTANSGVNTKAVFSSASPQRRLPVCNAEFTNWNLVERVPRWTHFVCFSSESSKCGYSVNDSFFSRQTIGESKFPHSWDGDSSLSVSLNSFFSHPGSVDPSSFEICNAHLSSLDLIRLHLEQLWFVYGYYGNNKPWRVLLVIQEELGVFFVVVAGCGAAACKDTDSCRGNRIHLQESTIQLLWEVIWRETRFAWSNINWSSLQKHCNGKTQNMQRNCLCYIQTARAFVSGNWLLLLEKGKLSIFCILVEKKKQKPQLVKTPVKNPGFFLTGKHSSRCKCEGLQRSKKLKVLCHRCTGKTSWPLNPLLFSFFVSWSRRSCPPLLLLVMQLWDSSQGFCSSYFSFVFVLLPVLIGFVHCAVYCSSECRESAPICALPEWRANSQEKIQL